MKAPRPERGWAIVNYDGQVWLWTVSYTRREAIQKADENLSGSGGWPYLRRQGCRAIKITVVAS